MTVIAERTHRQRRRAKSAARLSWKAATVRWCVLGILGFFTTNWVYQAVRKPGEIFAPVSGLLAKSPASTWQSYRALFEEHSTGVISPEFLAALAQVESDGNPIARTAWRWQWSWSPFELYRPVSSAAGMFQITDGTFQEARRFCIHNHEVVTQGPWHNWNSCWFNRLYTRNLPSHAVEMTSAYLHQKVTETLTARRMRKASLAQKQQLAAVIHLCGPRRGNAFAGRGFRAQAGELCGAHSLEKYLKRIEELKESFAQMAAN